MSKVPDTHIAPNGQILQPYIYTTTGAARYAVKCESCEKEIRLPQGGYDPYFTHRASDTCRRATNRRGLTWVEPPFRNQKSKPKYVAAFTVEHDHLVEVVDCIKEEFGAEHDEQCEPKLQPLSFPVVLSPLRSNIAKPHRADAKLPCKICDATVTLQQMRHHVGGHILGLFRGLRAEASWAEKVGVDPCGFCGLDGCVSQRHASMKYETAQTHSNTENPCTNIPLQCPLCPPSISGHPVTVWKYNAIFHLISHIPVQ